MNIIKIRSVSIIKTKLEEPKIIVVALYSTEIMGMVGKKERQKNEGKFMTS